MGAGHAVDPEFGKDFKVIEKKDNRTLIQLQSGKQVFLASQFAENEKEFDANLQKFRRRLQSFPNDDSNVLRVLKVLPPEEQNFCSESKKFDVVVEGYVKSLATVFGLSEIHSVFLLHETLNGYANLSKYNSRVSDLDLTPKMVFFNQEDIIKVWLNEKIDLDSPLLKIDSKLDETNENKRKAFIQRIFNMVEPHCIDGSYTPRLQNYISQHYPPENYGQAINMLKNFVRQYYDPSSSEFAKYMHNSKVLHPGSAPRKISNLVQFTQQPIFTAPIAPQQTLNSRPPQIIYTAPITPITSITPITPITPTTPIVPQTTYRPLEVPQRRLSYVSTMPITSIHPTSNVSIRPNILYNHPVRTTYIPPAPVKPSGHAFGLRPLNSLSPLKPITSPTLRKSLSPIKPL